MADQKITELNELAATPANDDLLPIVDISETPDLTKKISIVNLMGAGRFSSKARAYLSADQTIANETPTKVALATENYDGLDEFDPVTNYRFTATVAGYYMVTAQVTYENPTIDTNIAVYIYKNGAAVAQNSFAVAVSTLCTVLVSDIIYLAAGNYLELYTEHNSGGNEILRDSSVRTFMSVHRLS